MRNDHRDTYIQFAGNTPELPLFWQPWYLDAVCVGGNWEVAMVEKGGKVAAVMPYFIKKKWGRQYVTMPVLGRMMGPWLAPEFRTPRHESGLLDELVGQLPAVAAFSQDFHPSITNWLPFYWRGYRQTTRYTYTLDLSNAAALEAGLAADYRNNKIPKARQLVRLDTDVPLAEFYRVHNLSFERKNLHPPFSFDFLQRVDTALASHNSRAILGAADLHTGALHAVAYLVWDGHCAYYLLAGDDPALRQSGAGILLAWETIRYARETLGLSRFDFLGSMIQPVERVRRQFGAVQTPYFRVEKEWGWGVRVWKVLKGGL